MRKRIAVLSLFLVMLLGACSFQVNAGGGIGGNESGDNGGGSGDDSGGGSTGGDDNPLWDSSQNSLRKGTKTLDFYNFNDLHGAVEYSSSSSEPGIARISTYLLEKKAQNPDGFVLTSSGDMWQGSCDSNLTHGALVVDWMNYAGFSAQAAGNHEFDWTIDVIHENQEKMNFPLLACNIIEDATGEPVDWASPYTTITRNGVHIGIVGAIGEGQTGSILSANVKGLTFEKPESRVAEWSSYLRKNGADIVLYLLHDTIYNITDEEISSVDLVFGAHTHTLETDLIGSGKSIPAVQASCNGKYVAHTQLTYDFSKSKVTYGSYGYTKDGLLAASPDRATEALWEPYQETINATKNRIVKTNASTIYRSYVPNIYNQYAYKYYEEVHETECGLDIFAVETNNARADITVDSSGNITLGAVYKALPFDNCLTIMKVAGSDISKLTSYSSSHWFLPGKGDIDRTAVTNYVTGSETYYILTVDYISTYDTYSDFVEIPYTFYEEDALPRNIVSRYLQNYPGNIV